MPKLKVERVISFSTEDKVHCASNMLLFEPTKKWKCQAAGEKAANIILQLERASVISSIDIGNEHSAYVEVLVKRSGNVEDFKVLLVMSSFMTPLESRQSTNINKVRMFSYNNLQSPERDEKWDQVKIVCTQPFNRHVQYGLSFITFQSLEGNNATNSAENLGKFTLRPDSPNDLKIGSLFARRKEIDVASPLSAAASIREASSSSTIAVKSPKTPLLLKNNKISKMKVITENNNNSPKARNRDELLYSKDEEEKHEKIDNIIKKRQKEIEEKMKKVEDTKGKQKKKEENKAIEIRDRKKENVTSPSSSTKRKLIDSTPSSSSKKPKLKQKKLYNDLLEGVTIVISGIENPERADIRNKALELGAKYRPDWNNSCTHLICAFTNTPKFNQVKGKGKIVNRVWIQDCYTQRKRLPWRRYALDPKDLNKEESEEEICEEVTETFDLKVLHTNSSFDNDSPDTEDEIERITLLNSSHQNNCTVDTDEENFCTNPSKKTTRPELPSLLTNKIIYVDHNFSDKERSEMIRYIIALNGIISDVPVGVDLMITTSDKVDMLREVCSFAQFVSPNWLWDSYNEKRLVPVDNYVL